MGNEKSCYLALTAQEEYWDTTKPVVFLGSWCLLHERRTFWEPLSGHVMASPFSSISEAESAYAYVEGVYEKTLPLLADAMNLIHGKSYSLRYWRIVLGPWLYDYISVVYDRYVHIKRALEAYPNFETTVLSKSSFVTPLNARHFTCMIVDDSFNHQIYSDLLLFFGKEFSTIESKPKQSSLYNLLTQKTWKHRLASMLTKLYVQVTSKISPIRVVFRSTYFPISSEFKLLRSSTARMLLIKDRDTEPLGFGYDLNMRDKIKKISFGEDDFLKCLSEMLFSSVPKCFVEGFQATSETGESKYPDSAKVIFSANAWYCDELFKSWAAGRTEKGALLLGTPHGGNYGPSLCEPGAKHEMAIVDNYYSWGWDRKGCAAEIIPMPATKLSQIKIIGADNQKKGILWVATAPARYLFQFPNVPRLSQEYLSWQKIFLESFPHALLLELRLRAHYQDNGWGLVSRLKEIEPSLKLDSWDVPFLESLEKCRLYVCDHLSTTFTEALASNKPTILFWDRDNNPLKPEAEPYFDLLRNVGILFDRPEAAAEAVQYAYADVELWWNDVDRQEAVKAFCHQFARTSPDALAIWEDELRRVLLEADRSCST